MAQSIPSVPFPPGHLSFCFGKAANAPRWGRAFIQKPHCGALNTVQIPHPGTTLKFHFSVNTLQIPNLWEIFNNLIKIVREAPYANRS